MQFVAEVLERLDRLVGPWVSSVNISKSVTILKEGEIFPKALLAEPPAAGAEEAGSGDAKGAPEPQPCPPPWKHSADFYTRTAPTFSKFPI